jgi:hypothetical protein
MKGVRCSWVDMQKIRQALSGKKRGDQAALEHMRCVDQSTVSTWKAICDAMEAIDGKHSISNVSHCQPSHVAEIARAYRRKQKDLKDEAVKEEREFVWNYAQSEQKCKKITQAPYCGTRWPPPSPWK